MSLCEFSLKGSSLGVKLHPLNQEVESGSRLISVTSGTSACRTSSRGPGHMSGLSYHFFHSPHSQCRRGVAWALGMRSVLRGAGLLRSRGQRFPRGQPWRHRAEGGFAQTHLPEPASFTLHLSRDFRQSTSRSKALMSPAEHLSNSPQTNQSTLLWMLIDV